MAWSYEYRDKPRPCYRIQDGSDDGDVAEAWDEDVAQAIVAALGRGQDAADECAEHITEDRTRIAELERECEALRKDVSALKRTYSEDLGLMSERAKSALQHLGTARPALKWVLDHWGRTEPELSGHDQSHAQIARDEVLKAIDELRGYRMDSSPESVAAVRKRFGM